MNNMIKEIEEVLQERERMKRQKILYEGIRALDMALNTGRALTSEQLEARELLLTAFVDSCYVDKK